MSRYWFARLILGVDSISASAFGLSIPAERKRWTHRCATRGWHRKTYRALRAQGLSPYEVQARMRGTTPEEQQRRQIRDRRRYRAKWGGDPTHVGSVAWQRWMLTRAGVEDVA